jgi:hypothetical protein
MIEIFMLLLYFFFIIAITNTRSGLHFLIITELIWVCLFIIYTLSGYFFDSIYFYSTTLFILILAAVDAGIWILLLCFAKQYSNFFYKNNTAIKFMYRARRLSYLNSTFL